MGRAHRQSMHTGHTLDQYRLTRPVIRGEVLDEHSMVPSTHQIRFRESRHATVDAAALRAENLYAAAANLGDCLPQLGDRVQGDLGRPAALRLQGHDARTYQCDTADVLSVQRQQFSLVLQQDCRLGSDPPCQRAVRRVVDRELGLADALVRSYPATNGEDPAHLVIKDLVRYLA